MPSEPLVENPNSPGATCYICNRKYSRETLLADGPSNSGFEECQVCPHYYCVECLSDMKSEYIQYCPQCNFDWSNWLQNQDY